ncbi:MAG: DUF1294 domain-containing protein [Muribaculaceae bacterium]|nr:DUF1294 domain-containing protein [Muribaculaceae bacterium]MDE6134884.1 DUF1294 domain-containing protein [Muribaculaceae bacterium]
MFAYDKHCARFGKWRIPESVLLAGGVLMGAFGALCGMILFNHKTSKKLFYILVPLMLLVQTLAAVTVMMTDTL